VDNQSRVIGDKPSSIPSDLRPLIFQKKNSEPLKPASSGNRTFQQSQTLHRKLWGTNSDAQTRFASGYRFQRGPIIWPCTPSDCLCFSAWKTFIAHVISWNYSHCRLTSVNGADVQFTEAESWAIRLSQQQLRTPSTAKHPSVVGFQPKTNQTIMW